eukprot:m.172337 g.172337  ORF g.172337 m.172337 type:complete len:294 (-) comp31681_c2_seq1:125-1006(-)
MLLMETTMLLLTMLAKSLMLIRMISLLVLIWFDQLELQLGLVTLGRGHVFSNCRTCAEAATTVRLNSLCISPVVAVVAVGVVGGVGGAGLLSVVFDDVLVDDVVVDEWVWTASPGGNWSDGHVISCNITMGFTNTAHVASPSISRFQKFEPQPTQVFEDQCVVDPDGSLDRCGGHFPCAANVALVSGRHVVYGFNGEGWHGAQANQWLHFDALSGLFIGQFGTVNGIHDPRYTSEGWSAPGAAGNSFAATLVNVTVGVTTVTYLYHNDESVHGGVHRWKITGLDEVERVSVTL